MVDLCLSAPAGPAGARVGSLVVAPEVVPAAAGSGLAVGGGNGGGRNLDDGQRLVAAPQGPLGLLDDAAKILSRSFSRSVSRVRSSSASSSSTARLRVRISQASRWAVSSRLRTSASTVAATCSESHGWWR